jgi:hypothetical protein
LVGQAHGDDETEEEWTLMIKLLLLEAIPYKTFEICQGEVENFQSFENLFRNFEHC